ncbi:MAG: YlbF family regulator [Alicyclobacillaceae bacterium]|nr:YlbF family regulator [Alicyclobacillaceae bacterium]
MTNTEMLEDAKIEEWSARADEVAEMIRESDVAAQFWQAREKMSRHARAIELFEMLKQKTNNIKVLESHYGLEHPRLVQAKAELTHIEDELSQIPVAFQYQCAQSELNMVVQEVVQRLMQRLRPVLPIEPGPRQGCGHGPDGQGCTCGESH